MKSLKGSRTAENLLKACAGESQARNRYTFYASAANKEGFMQIQGIFADTADNESGFKIERRIGAGGYSQIAVVGAGVTNFTDVAATPGSTNTYRVRAFNALMDTPYSNEAAAKTPGVLLAPTLISTGSVWRFFDKTNDLGTSWRSNSFNDTTWSSGPARLGFGGDGEITKVASNKQWTTYFRRTFYLTDRTLITALGARLTRDDGVVLYLNGAEVWRDNMPAGIPSFLTLASTTISGADETNWLTNSLSPSALVTGWNTLAAEVHQSTNSSSDIGFDFELTGVARLPAPPVVTATRGGASLSLSWPAQASYFTLYATTNLAPPVVWRPATNTAILLSNQWAVTLPAATNGSRFYRLQTP